MSEYAVALASGVDTAQRVRLAEGALLPATGALQQRTGLLDGGGAVTLVSGMQTKVTAFRAFIQGTSAAAQGGYFLVADADKTLTHDNGDTSARTDLIVGRVRDNAYDGSGQTAGSVEIVKGTAGGGVPGTPAGCVALATVPIPANVTAGSGGLTTAPTDVRPPRLVASGGILPVLNATDRGTLVTYPGLTVYRMDLKTTEQWNGTAWGPAAASSLGLRGPASTGAVATATWTVVPLTGTADHQIGSGLSAASSVITVAEAGLYTISALVCFDQSATGRRVVHVEKFSTEAAGAGTTLAVAEAVPASGVYVTLNTGTEVSLNAGDKVRVVAYQSSGASVNIRGDLNVSQLNMRRVA